MYSRLVMETMLRITWNATLKVKYDNLLVLAEIARVRCVRTSTCERTFLVQKLY